MPYAETVGLTRILNQLADLDNRYSDRVWVFYCHSAPKIKPKVLFFLVLRIFQKTATFLTTKSNLYYFDVAIPNLKRFATRLPINGDIGII